MKLLPAALLTLLSAASSILPSVAAETEKESASGVARKLTGKTYKDGYADKMDDNWYRGFGIGPWLFFHTYILVYTPSTEVTYKI
jgi:hypothetical protein